MQKIDANIVLRYLMNDHPERSPKAKEIIDKNIVEVPIEVLCEVVFVLKGHYGIDRSNISAKLKYFFEQTQCILPHQDAVLRGLEYYGQKSLDFVDCILAGYADVEKDEIFTFDEKLQKLIQIIKKDDEIN
ncbi:MAG: PIN domain-containing protein [Leptospirales bacterium]|nr:PIN domain-containing protein [Leptospirales bacterium]